jgi:hypothetical protein
MDSPAPFVEDEEAARGELRRLAAHGLAWQRRRVEELELARARLPPTETLEMELLLARRERGRVAAVALLAHKSRWPSSEDGSAIDRELGELSVLAAAWKADEVMELEQRARFNLTDPRLATVLAAALEEGRRELGQFSSLAALWVAQEARELAASLRDGRDRSSSEHRELQDALDRAQAQRARFTCISASWQRSKLVVRHELCQWVPRPDADGLLRACEDKVSEAAAAVVALASAEVHVLRRELQSAGGLWRFRELAVELQRTQTELGRAGIACCSLMVASHPLLN